MVQKQMYHQHKKIIPQISQLHFCINVNRASGRSSNKIRIHTKHSKLVITIVVYKLSILNCGETTSHTKTYSI